jgi:regulator of replication initiation timing
MSIPAQDLWGRIRTGLEQGLSVLWKGTSDLTLKTMAEADTFRLRMEVRRLSARLSEGYCRLGRQVFDALESREGGEARDFPERVREIRLEIEQLEQQLRKVEEEIGDLKTLHLQPR